VKKNITSEVTRFLQQEGIQNQNEIFATPGNINYLIKSF